MSDDDDDNDRMERANRIREMREGRRSRGREETDGDADEAATAETDTPEAPADDEATATATDADEATATATDADDDEAPPGTDAESGDSTPTIDGTVSDPDAADATGSGFQFEGDATAADSAAESPGQDADGDEPESAASTDAGAVAASSDGDDATPAAEMVTDVDPAAAAAAAAEMGLDPAVAQAAAAGSGLDATFSIPDQATTVSAEEEGDALADADGSVAAARAAAGGGDRHATGDQVRVLEFDLGGERFCLDIDYIEEIVELENLTRVPNSPSFVEGVVDLRGQVTAIINPKDQLDVADESVEGGQIIVFDSEKLSEQGHLGWLVDDVRQVTPVSEEDVNESPDEDEDYINGVINRDDEDDFVVWTTPELALNS